MPETRLLTDEEREELREAAESVALEGMDDLHVLMEDAIDGEQPLDDEAIFHLGVWWGEQIRLITGWKWKTLVLGEGLEGPALIAKDASVAFLPLQWVAEVVEGRRPNDLRETWERLRRGERPQAPPGSLALFA